MKKTKILIPALGMMMLSTAAAVSGTMAWFTANRAISIETTNFTIEALDGNLSIDYANIEGTGRNADNHETAPNKIYAKGNLGDASYDETGATLYTDVPTDDGSQPTNTFKSVGTLADAIDDGNTDNIWKVGANYYGLAFKLTITYAFGVDTTSLDIFFDFKNSNAVASYGNTGTGHTAPGFRVAMVTTSKKLIWAPLRNSTDTYDDDGVPGTDEVAVPFTRVQGENQAPAAYANPVQIIKGDYKTSNNLAADSTNGNQSRVDYLGTVTAADVDHNSNKLEVTCVVWFEGTDPAIRNEKTMDSVSSLLRFYSRKIYQA